jgi:hypothetical protein
MGNTKAYFIAVCIVVATVGQCFAAGETGNQIRDECQIDLQPRQNLNKWTLVDASKAGFCNGFVWAVFHLGSDLAEPSRFCPPDEANLKQAELVLLKYLNEHPERTHEDAVTLAVHAFKAAWPCH